MLILGGMHGDEPKSVFVAQELVALLSESPPTHTTIVVTIVNPDGYERGVRRNARGVDINRNFPTRDWKTSPQHRRFHGGVKPASESETRAIVRLVESRRPVRIVTIHSISEYRHCNNYDGPAGALARRMAKFNKYPVTSNIGYPTPGSFGTWAGIEGGIPTVTLELPSHHSRKRCWEDNAQALSSCCHWPVEP